MRTRFKLGAYGAALVLVFGAAMTVGSTAGPIGSPNIPTGEGGDEMTTMDRSPAHASSHPALGLEISAQGYTLVPAAATLSPGRAVNFRFRIDGPDGARVTAFDRTHDQDLHLIAVRRDLSGFQHVHPVRDPAGTWSVPLDLSSPGTYRVLADFKPAGSSAMSLVLGADLFIPGSQVSVPLPAPAPTASVDGYTVALDGDLVAGQDSKLTLTIDRNGVPVTDLEPYLAAYGHLVALRSGDLAYLHVHPDGEPGDGRTPAGPSIVFHAEVPSVGVYRLYLDFQRGGQVHTAEFTVHASGASAPSRREGD
jgi:hypothetical protein